MRFFTVSPRKEIGSNKDVMEIKAFRGVALAA